MSCRDITLGKSFLVLLTLACLKETLDIASSVIYTVIVVETDYRTCSLKSRGRYRQLSQSTVLHLLAVGISTKYIKIIRNERHQLGEGRTILFFKRECIFPMLFRRHMPIESTRAHSLLARSRGAKRAHINYPI